MGRNASVVFRSLLLVLLVNTLSGCLTQQVGSDLIREDDRFGRVSEGTSHKQDVYRVFGQPHDVRTLDDGSRNSSWLYFGGDVSVSPGTYIPYVGMVIGGSDTDIEVASFEFDSSGLVVKIERRSEKFYSNMWVDIATLATPDKAGERVQSEMKTLDLPFYAEIARQVKTTNEARD